MTKKSWRERHWKQQPNTVKLPGATHWCPRCGMQCNGAAVVLSDERAVPEDDDFSICIGCGMVMRFRGDKLEPVSVDELAMLKEEEREELRQSGLKLGFSVLGLIRSKGPVT